MVYLWTCGINIQYRVALTVDGECLTIHLDAGRRHRFTLTVSGYTPGAWASLGVQENTPETGSMPARPGHLHPMKRSGIGWHVRVARRNCEHQRCKLGYRTIGNEIQNPGHYLERLVSRSRQYCCMQKAIRVPSPHPVGITFARVWCCWSVQVGGIHPSHTRKVKLLQPSPSTPSR